MSKNARGFMLVGAVVVVFLMVFVLPAGLASAAGPSSNGSGTTLWAYGAARTITFHGTTPSGWQYQGNATFGSAVILDQFNSTNGHGFELTLNRTMGVLLDVEACAPSCGHPAYLLQESYHSWETTDAWANFTLAGNVTEGTAMVPAIALENTNTAVSAHLVEHNSTTVLGVDRSRSLSVNVSGEADVVFVHPLGLLPLNLSLSSPASWSAASSFAASGSGHWNFGFAATGPNGPIAFGRTGSVSVSGNGTVEVLGSYSLGNYVSFDGVTYPAIDLTIVGPFAVREGVIFIPVGGDLFGGGAQPWSGNQSGTATVSQSAIDALPTTGGHFGLVASAWLYSASGSVGVSADYEPSVSGLTALSEGSSAPVPATSVQGEPQSPAEAQATQNCLATGAGCPAGSSGPSPLLPHGLLLVVVGVVVVAIVIAATVLVAERRRMPPPPYPNANLYPPGTPPPAATGAGPSRPAGTPPPAEEDPLSHLW